MKYLNLNQTFGVEQGLSIQELAIYSYISGLHKWANSVIIDGEIYYRLHLTKMLSDMPILYIKTKSGINRIINKLEEKNLISRRILNNEPYFRISSLKSIEDKDDLSFLGGCEEAFQGGASSHYNSNNIIVNNKYMSEKKTKKQEIDTLYLDYSSRVPKEKKKYIKSAQAKLYIERLLKEFSFEELSRAIENYFRKTESIYIMAPQYFFSDTKNTNAKTYRPFLDYIEEENTKQTQPQKRDFNIGF